MSDQSRSAGIAIRVRPAVKQAAQAAARDCSRTLSNFIEATITDWLTAQSYLSAGQRERGRAVLRDPAHHSTEEA